MFHFIDKNGAWHIKNTEYIVVEWRNEHLHEVSYSISYVLAISKYGA